MRIKLESETYYWPVSQIFLNNEFPIEKITNISGKDE
jgi:hypothetical protein